MEKDLICLDLEVYPNYTLFAFKNIVNSKVVTIEIKGESRHLTDIQSGRLSALMHKCATFGFNSRNYDIPIITYALTGKTAAQLFVMSTRIIEGNSPGWKIMDNFRLRSLDIDHIDIQEPAPGVRISLKLYGGRMHSQRLQDLPIEPGTLLSAEQMQETLDYCLNDLDTTIELYRAIEDRIGLRVDMSARYGQDLRSKSDAQIGEAIIKSELQRVNAGARQFVPKFGEGVVFNYTPPDFISFESSRLQEVLKVISKHNYQLDDNGAIQLPSELQKLTIELGHSTYQLGLGGIHSSEKKQTIVPGKRQILIDKDVASYYPSIILGLGLYPKHLGLGFLTVYNDIVASRLAAKKAGDTVVNESLKIVINGGFGKLCSQYSVLYAPDLFMAVTLTGQLSLLMLIEQIEKKGISVVSANTDGFVSLMPWSKYDDYDDVCFDWECRTGFNLDETRYKALYSRDINNYLAITNTGKVKGKGVFNAESLMKNPQSAICTTAVKELIIRGTPIEDTIRECRDVRLFLQIRTVNGGAMWRGDYLGKVVRWVYSTKGDSIVYKTNGNKVPKSDWALPIMELCELPDSIDYDRYIREAVNMYGSLGAS